MKFTEFLNELSKKGDRLRKEEVKELFSHLHFSNNSLMTEFSLQSGGSDKSSKHLISNTENFTCFTCEIPSGVNCDQVISDYSSLVVLVLSGTLYIQKKQGVISSSFYKTSSTDFRILKSGEVDEIRIPDGELVLSNPFSEPVQVLCVHLKDFKEVGNEVSSLTAEFDSINGIKI